MEEVSRFMQVNSGSGSGSGSGLGSDSGYGNCDGYGYGYGSGSGSNSSLGFGPSSGSGDGNGSGYGSSDGTSYGDGGIKSINGQQVFMIDGIPTVILKAKGNLAKGYTVNDDLTTTPCFVAKSQNIFAHGRTAKEALAALQDKLFEDLDTEERIKLFIAEFPDLDKKYPARAFYDWHHKLTGSCEFGRNQFVKSHGIDLDRDTYTVREFISLAENDYGGEVLKEIEGKIGGER